VAGRRGRNEDPRSDTLPSVEHPGIARPSIRGPTEPDGLSSQLELVVRTKNRSDEQKKARFP